MNKHAYLIMAHNQFVLLSKLLECIDHERNDIFIHIDSKSTFSLDELRTHIKKSRLYFTKRINVIWGAYSQIEAEVILLETATSNGIYEYYHLITGVDFPLKKQDDIFEFFDLNKGKEFISLDYRPRNHRYKERIMFFYPFQELFKNRNSMISKGIRKLTINVQKAIHINRTKERIKLGLGSAYFDITDEFARFIVGQKDFISKYFKNTFCVDELFIQVLWLNWGNHDEARRYRYDGSDVRYIQRFYLDVKRAIDWTRGNPYTFYSDDDYKLLMESSCLFARKFDYETHPEIVDKIYKNIKED